MAAAPRLECDAAPEALEVAQRVVAHEHHVAAAAAVAAVGAALGHVGLAAEAQAAVAAGAGLTWMRARSCIRARRLGPRRSNGLVRPRGGLSQGRPISCQAASSPVGHWTVLEEVTP